jgi:hypothetical protein
VIRGLNTSFFNPFKGKSKTIRETAAVAFRNVFLLHDEVYEKVIAGAGTGACSWFGAE